MKTTEYHSEQACRALAEYSLGRKVTVDLVCFLLWDLLYFCDDNALDFEDALRWAKFFHRLGVERMERERSAASAKEVSEADSQNISAMSKEVSIANPSGGGRGPR